MIRRRGVMFSILCGLAAVAVFLSTAAVLAKPGVVRTRDGQTYSGELDESNPETITVTAGRIPTSIPRGQIASIEYAEDYEKKFRDRLGKLPPQDVQGRMQLAKEAMDSRQYVLARDAAEAARVIDPNNAEAAELVATAQSQISLERKSQQQQPQPGAPAADAPGGPSAAAAPGGATQPAGDRLLKPDQINAIRQAELRPEDVGVRVRFDRDVRRRFADHTARPLQDVTAMPVSDLIQAILKEGTPEMRRDVIIQSDPPALMEYRRNIQPFILNNCATAGCHGPVNGQKFSLISPADNDAAVYTNFYILQGHKRKMATSGDTVFGRAELRMIDRQAPADSMLLQYGLPGAVAEFDHPDVPGYRPPYRAMNDPRYVQIRNWIGQSLIAVPPDYGFGPGAAGGGQPATREAATQPTGPAAIPPPAPDPATAPPSDASRPTATPAAPAPSPAALVPAPAPTRATGVAPPSATTAPATPPRPPAQKPPPPQPPQRTPFGQRR